MFFGILQLEDQSHDGDGDFDLVCPCTIIIEHILSFGLLAGDLFCADFLQIPKHFLIEQLYLTGGIWKFVRKNRKVFLYLRKFSVLLTVLIKVDDTDDQSEEEAKNKSVDKDFQCDAIEIKNQRKNSFKKKKEDTH